MTKIGARPSIVVVEDESLVRSMAVEMFEEAGFRVLEASSGERALEIIRTCGELAALFTDVELESAMSGVSLARIVHDGHPETAILIVSGRGLGSDQELPPGARFLGKPYDPDVVTRMIGDMLAPADPV